jgi:adenylate cyclase
MFMVVGESRQVHQSALGFNGETPGPKAAVEQLERILASGDFDASPRSRAFIRFIIEETLAGRQEALTQAAIATRVFGRREDFDPTVDPIVRIQAGRLRRSLERYYLLSGAGDPVRIELPRGSYVPALRWASPAERPEAETDAGRPSAAVDDWPCVVVLPFESAASDPGLHEAAARFREQLVVEMDRYRDVRVVLRSERDRPGSWPRGARRFQLSGRLSRDEGGRRLTAHLLDSRTANQVWAQEYRGGSDLSSTFYEETARIVAVRVASEQGAVAQGLWVEQRRRPPAVETPYGAILRSYQFFFNRDPADLAPAVEALKRVVAAEPECSLAWVQLSRLYSANYAFEVAAVDTPIEEALAFAQQGVRRDPTGQRARGALAFALLLKGELAASRVEAQNALDVNPDSLVYLESIGWVMTLCGDWERGPALVQRALARNPHHMPVAFHALWVDHLRRGELDQAYQAALQFSDAAFFWRALMRACCLGHLGRLPEARLEVAELLASMPDFAGRGRALIGRLIKFPDLFERIVEGLGKAGLALD